MAELKHEVTWQFSDKPVNAAHEDVPCLVVDDQIGLTFEPAIWVEGQWVFLRQQDRSVTAGKVLAYLPLTEVEQAFENAGRLAVEDPSLARAKGVISG